MFSLCSTCSCKDDVRIRNRNKLIGNKLEKGNPVNGLVLKSSGQSKDKILMESVENIDDNTVDNSVDKGLDDFVNKSLDKSVESTTRKTNQESSVQ